MSRILGSVRRGFIPVVIALLLCTSLPGKSNAEGALQSAPSTALSSSGLVLPVVPSQDFYAGVNVLAYGVDFDFDDKVASTLDYLDNLNVDSVALVFPLTQEAWNSSTVTLSAWTPTNDNIRSFVKAAHSKGMNVTIRPILDGTPIPQNSESCQWMQDGTSTCYWRGNIQPVDHNKWFASYASLLTSYAQIAQSEKAEVFSVGVELNSLAGLSDQSQWKTLVDSVRNVYSGKLEYSSNPENTNNAVFPLVDIIGVDAYYRLPLSDDATSDDIAKAWQLYTPSIGDLRLTGKPVILTEVETRDQKGSYRDPSVWNHGNLIDEGTQKAYYTGTCQAVRPIVSGVYFSQIVLDLQGLRGIQRKFPDFSFHGKSSEQAVQQCYQGE